VSALAAAHARNGRRKRQRAGGRPCDIRVASRLQGDSAARSAAFARKWRRRGREIAYRELGCFDEALGKPRPNRPSATGERVARFARTDCEPCPLRQQFAPGGQRDIRIGRCEDLRQAALENHPSRPSAPRSSSTSTRSERPCVPRPHSRSRPDRKRRPELSPTGRKRHTHRRFFSGLPRMRGRRGCRDLSTEGGSRNWLLVPDQGAARGRRRLPVGDP
jgi:hypothetical protein